MPGDWMVGYKILTGKTRLSQNSCNFYREPQFLISYWVTPYLFEEVGTQRLSAPIVDFPLQHGVTVDRGIHFYTRPVTQKIGFSQIVVKVYCKASDVVCLGKNGDVTATQVFIDDKDWEKMQKFIGMNVERMRKAQFSTRFRRF